MGTILEKMGIDGSQWKAIVWTSIRRDFRGHSGATGKNRRVPPIVRSVIFYGLMGSLMAVNLVSRVTPFAFSLLLISYSMVMMAFAVILEFGQSIVHPGDADILLPRPIHPRTLFFAKLCHLLFYIILIGTALCLVPAIMASMIQNTSWTFPIVFFVVANLANLATASFIVLVYTGLSMMMRTGRFKSIMTFVQIFLMFVIFFTYQLIPRLNVEWLGEGVSGKFLWVLPPAWFAGLIESITFPSTPSHLRLAILGCGATILLFGFALRRISRVYTRLIQKQEIEAESRLKAARPKEQRAISVRGPRFSFFRSSDAQAGFYLTSRILRRDRFVKTAILPLLGMPLAILVLAIMEGEVVDPFVVRPFTGDVATGSMVTFFIFFMITLFLTTMVYSHEPEASWIFFGAPLESPGNLYRGVKGSIIVWLILPFFCIFGAAFCFLIPVVHAVKYIVSLLIMGLLALSCSTFLVRDFPFSRKRVRGERIQRFSALFLIAPLFVVAVAFQSFIYVDSTRWWAAHSFLLVVFFILESVLKRRLDRILIPGVISGTG